MEHEPLRSRVGKSATKIWEAYQEVLEELQQKEEVSSTTVVAEAKKIGDAIKLAKSVDVDALVDRLNTIANGLKEAKDTFNELEVAIDAKKDELKSVHELEVDVNALVAVVATKDRLVKERIEMADEIVSKAEEKANEVLATSQKKIEELEKTAQEAYELAERDRKRKQEEWEYNFQRNSRSQMDVIDDNITTKTKALKEREDAVTEREEKADKLQGEIDDLQSKLDSIEEKTLARIEVAVEEAIAKTKKSEGFHKMMVEKGLKADLDIAHAKIESLEKQNTDLQIRLEKADAQISAANDRITAIATGALKAGADAQTVAKVAEVAAGAGTKK